MKTLLALAMPPSCQKVNILGRYGQEPQNNYVFPNIHYHTVYD